MGFVEVLDPTMEGPKVQRKLAPFLSDVNEKNVGFRIFWSRFDVFMEWFEELLREKYNVGEVVRYYGHMGDIAGAKTLGASEIMVGKYIDEAERKRLVTEFYEKAQWAVFGLAA